MWLILHWFSLVIDRNSLVNTWVSFCHHHNNIKTSAIVVACTGASRWYLTHYKSRMISQGILFVYWFLLFVGDDNSYSYIKWILLCLNQGGCLNQELSLGLISQEKISDRTWNCKHIKWNHSLAVFLHQNFAWSTCNVKGEYIVCVFCCLFIFQLKRIQF